MKAVILQPSYIPWRGYFHQISKADVFVFLDDVQYDRRGWRNRNRIKTAQGSRWLTIPVHSRGVQIENTPIKDIQISWEKDWIGDHWQSIESSYHRAPFFELVSPMLREYFQIKPTHLADFTIELTTGISNYIGIAGTKFIRSSSLDVTGIKTDRLISILKSISADQYLTGPSAKNYIEETKFLDNNISLEYMMYDYREYAQLYPPYDPQVSIIDLMFMTGPDSLQYIME
jgi:hypothetical protein